MPSLALQHWQSERAESLDEIATAHAKVGGSKRGRRYATEQINHAYAVLLSSQFQGFCRDLHSECVKQLAMAIQPARLQQTVRLQFLANRKLDHGNPNAGNLGADFGRLGITFWKDLDAIALANANRRQRLEDLNQWRNAIAHQDFDLQKLGGTSLRLADVRRWRRNCDLLANDFDQVMAAYIRSVTGTSPW